MKSIFLKLLSLSILLLISVNVLSQTGPVVPEPYSDYDYMDENGLCYYLYPASKTATVTYKLRRDPIEGAPVYYHYDMTTYNEEGYVSGNVVIPSTITCDGTTYDVTKIGNCAFRNCGLKSVEMPKTIIYIGDGAFDNCNLDSIIIPTGIKTINYRTFYSCPLKHIIIPNNVKSIGCEAFSNILDVILEEGSDPLYLDSLAFSSIKDFVIKRDIICSRLYTYITKLTISANLNALSNFAFGYKRNIKELYLEDSNNSLEIDSAVFENIGFENIFLGREVSGVKFDNIANLNKVTIGSNIENIVSGIFSNCPNLNVLVLDSASTALNIDEKAFENSGVNALVIGRYLSGNTFANNPLSVEILNNFSTIKENGFANLSTIKKLVITDGGSDLSIHPMAFPINKIESLRLGRVLSAHPFDSLTTLKTLSVGNAYKEIADSAFYGCELLTNLIIEDGTDTLTISKNAFENAPITSLYAGRPISEEALSGKEIEFVVGKQYTDLTSRDFSKLSAVTSLVIPNTVNSIGSKTFSCFSNLSAVTICNGDTDISLHESSFITNKITNLAVGRNITGYGYYSPFSEMKYLKKLSITSGATSLGEELFAYNSKLEKLIIEKGTAPLEIASSTFTESPFTTLKINRNITKAYFSNNTDINKLIIGGDIKTLSLEYFNNCTNLKEIILEPGESELSIFSSSIFTHAPIETITLSRDVSGALFSNKTTLRNLTITQDVTSIGNGLFAGCASLVDIAFPDSLLSIGSSAFSRCTGLTDIQFPQSLRTIGEYAFYGCTGLDSFTIPTGITNINKYTLGGLTGLTSLIIPDNITAISDNAIAKCHNLKEITIESGTTELTIDSMAFTNTPIEKITINRNITGTPFNGKSGIKDVIVGGSATTINDYAFSNCTGINYVKLSQDVANVGYYAFENCDSIELIDCVIPTPPSSAASAFSNETYANTNLFVSEAYYEDYSSTRPWSKFINLIGTKVDSVKIGIESDSLDVYYDSLYVTVGDTVMLSTTIIPEKATKKIVSWCVSDETIATISDTGELVSFAVGETVVTVTSTDGTNACDSCKIIVRPASVTVSVTSLGLATYCPAYPVDFSSAEKIWAYKAAVNGSSVKLTKVSTVAAGEGVLLRALSGGAETEELPIADFLTTAATDNEFVGTLADKQIYQTDGDKTNYVLSGEATGVGFYKAKLETDGGTTISAGKAYLPVTTSLQNGVNSFSIGWEDEEATGIVNVKAGNDAKATYTLQGIRIENPSKGLYIRNGKMIVIK